jgi:hypothetical protein
VLGRELQSILREDTFDVDSSRACDHIPRAIADKQPLTVRMTFAGIAGDAGVNYPDRLLFSGGRWKSALARNRTAFRTALTSREVCKVAHRYVVMHGISCMAACMGLSNVSMTPPFLPVGRNEDGLFGATLSAIDVNSVSCHVPYAVIHASSRPPRYTGRKFPSASETRSADLLSSLVNAFASGMTATRARGRLVAIGHWLQALAALPPKDFINVTRVAILRVRQMELGLIESALQKPAVYPEYWRRALRAYREELLRHMSESMFLLPLEFHHARSVKAGYEDLRRFVASAGELFVEWPGMWREARKKLRGGG